MADKKVTALTAVGTGITAADVWMVITDVATTPVNKKITVANFLRYLPSYIGFSGAPQAIATSVAVDVVAYCSTITCGAGNLTGGLPNGTVGQTKFITMVATTGGTFVCTPTLLNGGTTLTFAQDGDACTLLFTDTTNGWSIVGNNGVAVA
jgi:hypothetical protein